MIQRYAILLLLFVPAVVGGQERGSSNSRIVAQADTTSIHVPLTLAQQDAGDCVKLDRYARPVEETRRRGGVGLDRARRYPGGTR